MDTECGASVDAVLGTTLGDGIVDSLQEDDGHDHDEERGTRREREEGGRR
jgi:hypothetical protein